MTIRELRKRTDLSQSKFANIFHIPTTTIQQWEIGYRHPKEYIVEMMEKILKYEGYIDEDNK